MSNYAYIITRKSRPLPSSFLGLFDEGNISIYDVKNFTIYYIANKVKSCKGNTGYFKGYYIDHDNKKIGFEQNKSLHNDYYEGCFINIEEDYKECCFSLSGDVFGIMPILYTSNNDYVAISDSLYFLKKISQSLGYSINLDYENFISRTYINALTAHPLSSSTLVKEIKYALPGTKIEIKLLDEIKFKITHEGAKNIFKLDSMDYEQNVINSANQLCGFLGGLIESKVMPCTFDLTGGLDSRVVLAGATQFLENGNISVGSHINSKSDYMIAEKICDHFDIPLNVKESSKNIRINTGSMWLASNAGLYDTLYTTKFQRVNGFKFNVGGHGAEVFKGNYGWRKISNIGVNYENKEIYTLLQREMGRGLEEFGIDPEDDIGSEWHYLGFRNPIHSSRGTQVSNYHLRPLLMRSLVHNMKVKGNRNKFKKNPVSDMLIYINSTLAQFDFDDKRKNITYDDVQRVTKSLGKYSNSESLYTVEGIVNTDSVGYLPELLKMAVDDGFKNNIDINSCSLYINNCTLGKDAISNYTSNYLMSYIFDSSMDTKKTINQRNIAISKLLSLNIFN